MSTDQEPNDRIPLRELSPGRKRALIIAARVEFVLAALASIGVCFVRLTLLGGSAGPLWAVLGALIGPAYIMASLLALAHSRAVGRPLPALAPELAFWLVAPVAACVFLLIT